MLDHFPKLRLLMLVLAFASAGLSQTDANLLVTEETITLTPPPGWGPLPAREYHAAIELDNGKTYAWGGHDTHRQYIFSDGFESGDTGLWTERKPPPNTPVPPARARHALAKGADGALAVGGINQFGLLADFWWLDLQDFSWSQIFTPGPPPRAETHLVYLPDIGKFLLFSGMADTGYLSFHADTWLYCPQTGTWEQLHIPGPPPRSDGELIFVPGEGAMLFAGANSGYLNDTWLFDTGKLRWNQKFPTQQPPARFGHSMYWDASRYEVVMGSGVVATGGGFGQVSNDIWVFQKENWILSNTTGPLRVGATATYDPINECGRIVGGSDFLNTHGNSYLICSESPATIVPFGIGCAGTYGVPWLAPAPGSRPWIGNTQAVQLGNLPPGLAYVTFGYSNKVWGGIPLPLDLTAFGIWNCFSYASVDLAFPVVVTPGGTAQWQLSIPQLVSLVRLQFFLQVLALEAGINPFGAVTGNALEGKVGRR